MLIFAPSTISITDTPHTRNAHIPTLRLLLLHHAPLNATDRYGQTALILAASLGHTEVVRVLLEAGADPEKRDGKGQAPLAVAENFKHVEAAKLLREWIQARSEGVSATFATAEQGDKGKEKVTGPFALDTSNTRQVSSIFADQLTHEEIFGLPTPRQLSVPGAYGDPDPEPEETVPLEPEIPVPEPSMIEPDVPQPVPYAHLLPDGVSIAPSNENAIHPDLSSRLAIALERLASPPPSESALLSNFAELNDHASAEKGVREGVVKRMESIRFLREGIANFVSFAEKRGALVAELGLLGREAKEGVEDRAKEMQKIEETFSELDKERKATQDAMNAVATNLAGLQLSIGLPNEASGIVTEARAKVDATFDERAVGLEADKLRTEREQAGFEQAREAADACAQFAREQVGRAQASRASLEVVLKGAEQEHAGYLRELVARSLRVLHSIRRGLEQANEEAEQAVAVGTHLRLQPTETD